MSSETTPPIKIGESSFWKLDSKSLLGIIVLSGMAVTMYLNMKGEIADTKRMATSSLEASNSVTAKLQSLENKVGIMDGKLDLILSERRNSH